ncbi:MAG: deoxyribose-phosphate aldolase, partial [Bacteroidetes bacterium]|nr:deoxyribose-phosphate aldolase [Bacteroidota bacterium]
MNETLPNDASLARMIDHTLLRPDACESDIIQLCHEAKTYQFATVCVYPSWVQLCVAALKGSTRRICTVVGFPHGANQTDVKVYETDRALKDGATEVDMVMHVGRLKQGDSAYVEQDIAQVAGLVRE